MLWLKAVGTGRLEADELEAGHPVWLFWEAYLTFSLIGPKLEAGGGGDKN